MEKVVIMIIESATNVFWVTSTCRNSEHFEKLDYNSRVCAQCLGVFDKK